MTENKSQIGICLATYNGEKYIEEQLESIFSQTYQHFTLYIAEDNSSDKTVKMIKFFQERFPDRIDLQINDQTLGVVKNFEQLLRSCNEKYIAFCDQDDIWEKDKLQLQIDAIRKLECENPKTPCMVHSDLSMIDDNAKHLADSYFRFRGYCLQEQKDLGHILGPSGVMGNTVMINALLCEKVLPFPSDLEVHDYWIGVITELYGKRKTLFSPLVRYRIHHKNVSNSLENLQSKRNISQWLKRDLRLPYIESDRHKIIATLLDKKLSEIDKDTVKAFYDYLTFSKGRGEMFTDLIKYSLVKRGVWFRINLLIKILLTRRYHRAS